ncbi:hypothetical protein CLV56_0984 [Mumia flava]|uniref:DUF6542 domain-containing protein n=1 Tax=Mumia flava TaxID=1348852 RepID=A0A0B2B7G8_9ACTN|nr:DUF6542 domain-containing protein [Mumia flava]PJJ56771.1 hypothetical protein CLV56_0984 [Mumia flava]
MEHRARGSGPTRQPRSRRRRALTARAASLDLSRRGVVLVAGGVAGACAWADIGLTGRLGWFFDVMFVLVSITNALAAGADALYVPMITPPLVMLGVLGIVAAVAPSAIDEPGSPPDASWVQLVVVGLIAHAVALAIGYLAALGTVGWRRS